MAEIAVTLQKNKKIAILANSPNPNSNFKFNQNSNLNLTLILTQTQNLTKNPNDNLNNRVNEGSFFALLLSLWALHNTNHFLFAFWLDCFAYQADFLPKNYRTKGALFAPNSFLKFALEFQSCHSHFLLLINSKTRGGVEDSRLEAKAKAKDTKKFRSQGQGQILSRPRTKNTGASVLGLVTVSKIVLFRDTHRGSS